MDPAVREAADKKFQEALDATGARDPRGFYRQALRELKEVDASAYDRAVRHFQEVLVPSVASGEADPLTAWRDYGLLLAQVTAEGRTVEIDETGRARPYAPETSLDRMVLHLPRAKGQRAILVSLPPDPSPAQKATYALLVQGKHRL